MSGSKSGSNGQILSDDDRKIDGIRQNEAKSGESQKKYNTSILMILLIRKTKNSLSKLKLCQSIVLVLVVLGMLQGLI